MFKIPVKRYSLLGNPFKIGIDGDRAEVCRLYKEWFDMRVKSNDLLHMETLNTLVKHYREHGKMRLFCWCAPLQCHAETIKAYIEETVK